MKALILAVLFATALPGFAVADFEILSHRGLYQNYHRRDLTPETCTAERIYPPTHSYLENTIPSMAKAFELGADVVELDIHSTTDGHVVVFHDWTLDCRTEDRRPGEKPVTMEQTFAHLRSLDIGYGYTADGGVTHPFRCAPGDAACRMRNQMPSLREVLTRFPTKRFVINMKSRALFTLETLVAELRNIQRDAGYDLTRLGFYCADPSINDRMRTMMPEVKVPKLAMKEVNQCWQAYFRTKEFPARCHGADMGYPAEELVRIGKAMALRMVSDVHAMGSKLMIIRVDDEATFKFVSELPIDGIWTDEISVIGPLARPGK